VNDGVGQHGSRRRFRAENNLAAIFSQHARGSAREFRGKEARIVADDELRVFLVH